MERTGSAACEATAAGATSARRIPAGDLAPDCRHYRGDRPCLHNRLCRGCDAYAPYDHRLCIIKLGALGDVIRTLCVLPALREQYPNAHVTWVSLPNGCRMIASHPLIDRVLPFDAMTAMVLAHAAFDVAINLDKEPQPCALAMSLRAPRKLGLGLSQFGTPMPLNPEAEPYFLLGLSDELKFHRNTRSYPRLVLEALGLAYDGQAYELPVDVAARRRAARSLERAGWRARRPTLGVNVGAGRVFANKMWPAERTAELIRLVAQRDPGVQIVLLGGPDERPAIDRVQSLLRQPGRAGGSPSIFDGGTEHDEPGFVALVDLCDVLFAGDTMAMHVAIARGKHVVALFGPTCAQEIDLFGRGEKLVAQVACGPCYKRICDQGDVCIEAIGVADAANAVMRTLSEATGAAGVPSYPLAVLPQRKAG